jgi:hypothetical protein
MTCTVGRGEYIKQLGEGLPRLTMADYFIEKTADCFIGEINNIGGWSEFAGTQKYYFGGKARNKLSEGHIILAHMEGNTAWNKNPPFFLENENEVSIMRVYNRDFNGSAAVVHIENEFRLSNGAWSERCIIGTLRDGSAFQDMIKKKTIPWPKENQKRPRLETAAQGCGVYTIR